MEIIISGNSSKPIYAQITEQLKAQIMDGTLHAGESLPSMRSLAKSLHVSVITVQRAYEELQRDGFLETTVGRGSFVAAQNPEVYREAAKGGGAPAGGGGNCPRQWHFAGIAGAGTDHFLSGGRIAMQNILEVRDLGRSYVNFRLEHISFSIAGGTIMGLVGENGAGKSTTIRGILGLIRRECGEVLFCGEPLNTDSVAMKEQIGVVFDSLCFSPELTVEKAGKICRSIYSNWDEVYFQELLQQFSLLPKQKVKELSRGMSMKLSLVLAFAHHPKLLILDEPTSGLDPVVRDDLLDLFLEFVQDEEHAILISTHITSDLEKVADYVTFLHAGKLLLSKPKDELLWQYGILRCGEALFQKLESSEVLAWRKKDYSYDVLVPDREAILRKYPEAVIDQVTMDEILLLYVKGVQGK